MSVYKNTSFVLPLQKKSTKRALLTIKSPAKEIESTNRGILSVIIYLCSPKKISISNMKKIWILAVLTICSVATQAQEVFINADLVSSYIWRGMKNGNASVQPTLGVEWKGWTLSAWGSTEFRNENNEIDLTLEYEYKICNCVSTTISIKAKTSLSNTFTILPELRDILLRQEPSTQSVNVSLYP